MAHSNHIANLGEGLIRDKQRMTSGSNLANRVPGYIWIVVSFVTFLVVWEGLVSLGHYPNYLIPTPARVASRWVSAIGDGTWWTHTQVTLSESLLGFLLGFLVAVALGYVLAKSRLLSRALSPYVAASQSLPVIAIAPFLVLWFGYDLFPKVLVCALIVFFPILVNTLVGIRNIPRDMLEVAQVYGASRWQTIRMVEFPLALPVLLGGVRLGLTLSVTGAVVAELIGADTGLGVLINIANGSYDAPLRFVAMFTLILMAVIYYGTASLLDKWFLDWQDK